MCFVIACQCIMLRRRVMSGPGIFGEYHVPISNQVSLDVQAVQSHQRLKIGKSKSFLKYVLWCILFLILPLFLSVFFIFTMQLDVFWDFVFICFWADLATKLLTVFIQGGSARHTCTFILLILLTALCVYAQLYIFI